MSSLMYVDRKSIIYTGKRNDFESSLKAHFRVVKGQNSDICHRVSYKFMADAITNAINYVINWAQTVDIEYRSEENKAIILEEMMFYLEGIILATTLSDAQLKEIAELENTVVEDIKNINEKKAKFEEIIQTFCKMPAEEIFSRITNIMDCMSIYINAIWNEKVEEIDNLGCSLSDLLEDLLCRQNNSISNLFLGSSNWNRSIGECFDPKYGVITCSEKYEKEGRSYYIGVLNASDSAVFSILADGTKPGGREFNESELSVWAGVDKNEEIILYSSSQKGLLPAVDQLKDNVIIVYYNCFRRLFIPVDGKWEDNEAFMTYINTQEMNTWYGEINQ